MSLRGAILGFLALEPQSGYTLKQRFDGSVGSFWTATQSQIYRELHALEHEGLLLVDAVVPGDGKPDRKLYTLTASGRAALARWLTEPLEPLVLRHPLLLKFVFAADAPPDAVDALLATYAAGMEARRAEYVGRLGDPQIFSLARTPREAAMWRLSIEHGLAWCDTELAWIARARAALSPRSPKSRPKSKRGTTTGAGGKRWTRRER